MGTIKDEGETLAHDDMSDCIDLWNRDLALVKSWRKDAMIYCLLYYCLYTDMKQKM